MTPQQDSELLSRVRASASAASCVGLGSPTSELVPPFMVLTLSCAIHLARSCSCPRVL